MSDAVEALSTAVAALRPMLPGLARLRAAFALSPFECDIIVLGAGCELDARFAADVARAHDDPALRLPTLRLALAALEAPVWESLTGDAPLRRYELIEQAPAMSLVDAPYRVAERVLHELLGVAARDETLRTVLAPCEAAAQLSPANEATLAALTAAWGGRHARWPAIVLSGADGAAKRAIAARLARAHGLSLLRVDATALGSDAAGRRRIARLCERESALSGCALLIELDDDLEPPERRAAVQWIDDLRAATVVCVRERLRLPYRAVRHADVERPTPSDQRSLWNGVLGEHGAALNGQLDRVVSHFALDTDAVARIGTTLAGALPSGEDLWQLARHDARSSLDALAERLPQRYGWDSLALPDQQMDALREMVAHVRQRSRVFERWGFARDGRGLGASALFAGPSGTGKSLAAEVIANELGLDAYRIDLSQVVSKYIGETEKNLRRVFDAAEAGGAVLLFDEADALFGKRTEVRDSHDRYANIEVSYLLQRMESYRGLAILTTNFKNAIDDAFLRRLRFVIEFPFPDATQRAAIWSTIFPAQMPRTGLDLERLAQLNVTGGNIRNIALHAAFVAADHGDSVTMADLLRAARTEYAKLGRPIGEAELSGWR